MFAVSIHGRSGVVDVQVVEHRAHLVPDVDAPDLRRVRADLVDAVDLEVAELGVHQRCGSCGVAADGRVPRFRQQDRVARAVTDQRDAGTPGDDVSEAVSAGGGVDDAAARGVRCIDGSLERGLVVGGSIALGTEVLDVVVGRPDVGDVA